MSKSKVKTPRNAWFYVVAVGLTFLMPLLPVWQGPMSEGFFITCFVMGVLSGIATFGDKKSHWQGSLILLATVSLKDIFFERNEVNQYYLTILIQGWTTMCVAMIGVSLIYKRRRQNARLRRSQMVS